MRDKVNDPARLQLMLEAIDNRHVLVHDYYSVNMEMVWAIIKKDIPELKGYLLENAKRKSETDILAKQCGIL